MNETCATHEDGIERARQLFNQEFGEPAAGERLLQVHALAARRSRATTDHEGATLSRALWTWLVDALARPNGLDVVRLASDGYPTIEVSLESLDSQDAEKNTTASLVRGMAFRMAQDGRIPTGFDLAMTSTIPVGGGLSSSAAVEAALGRAMEALWKGRSYDALEMARMSQFAENVYFGKPCGLMDQASVCLGGLAFIDFAVPEDPVARRLEFDFEDHGYALCLVDVGSSHADLTDAYAAMPQEMQAVAAVFGKKRLCEVDQDDPTPTSPSCGATWRPRGAARHPLLARERAGRQALGGTQRPGHRRLPRVHAHLGCELSNVPPERLVRRGEPACHGGSWACRARSRRTRRHEGSTAAALVAPSSALSPSTWLRSSPTAWTHGLAPAPAGATASLTGGRTRNGSRKRTYAH